MRSDKSTTLIDGAVLATFAAGDEYRTTLTVDGVERVVETWPSDAEADEGHYRLVRLYTAGVPG